MGLDYEQAAFFCMVAAGSLWICTLLFWFLLDMPSLLFLYIDFFRSRGGVYRKGLYKKEIYKEKSHREEFYKEDSCKEEYPREEAHKESYKKEVQEKE